MCSPDCATELASSWGLWACVTAQEALLFYWAPWWASSSTWREKPTLLQAAQRRLAFALGTLSGLECLADDLVLMVVERVEGEVGSLP